MSALDAARGEIKALREQLATQKAGRALEQNALRNALDRFEAVRALHQPFPDDGVTYCGWDGKDGCGWAWPCPTIRALDGNGPETPVSLHRASLGRRTAVPGTSGPPDPPDPLKPAPAEGDAP